jgi:hypothetical protein
MSLALILLRLLSPHSTPLMSRRCLAGLCRWCCHLLLLS